MTEQQIASKNAKNAWKRSMRRIFGASWKRHNNPPIVAYERPREPRRYFIHFGVVEFI